MKGFACGRWVAVAFLSGAALCFGVVRYYDAQSAADEREQAVARRAEAEAKAKATAAARARRRAAADALARAKAVEDEADDLEEYRAVVEKVNRAGERKSQRFMIVEARKVPRDGSWVFLATYVADEEHPGGSPFALRLGGGDTEPEFFYGSGRYYWEVLPETSLASHFAAERISPSPWRFKILSYTINGPGSLDATLMTMHDGRKWDLVVRDYRDRSMEPSDRVVK